jgi:hypothetical protein
MNSRKDDLQILVSWISVKTSDIKSVAKNLNLNGLTQGDLNDFFSRRRESEETEEAKKGNIFLYCCNA